MGTDLAADMASGFSGQINGIDCVFLDPHKPMTVATIDLWKGNNRGGWQLNEHGRPCPVIIKYPIEKQVSSTVEITRKVTHSNGQVRDLPMAREAWEARGFRLAEEAVGAVCPPAILKALVEQSVNDLTENMKHDKAPYNDRKTSAAEHRRFLEAANPEVFSVAPENKKAARAEGR